jgi:antitoxin YefM
MKAKKEFKQSGTFFCTIFSIVSLFKPVSFKSIKVFMKTATVSEFRARMKEHLEELEKDQDVLILSGPKKKDFVLITLEAYNAMEETAHLLSTPANAARLLKSIAQDKAGQIEKTFEIKNSTGHGRPEAKITGLVSAKKKTHRQASASVKRKATEKRKK